MKIIKKYLTVIALILIISATFTISINADERKTSVDNVSVEFSLKPYTVDDVSIHHFCLVKAGYVGIRNVKIRGFYSAYYTNFFFCIGSVELDLKGFSSDPDEPRLIVKNLFGKTIYENDVSMSMTGFIGSVRPTGSVNEGHLKGFARIIDITLL